MQIAKTAFTNIISQAIDTILPPRCVITGETVEAQGMLAPKAWVELDFIAAPFCDACGFPFEFEAGGGSLCGSCLGERPPFETARAALKYNDSSRDLILGFKHADKMHSVLAFMPWLKRAGEGMLKEADYLVPVPLHRWRLISRRYNQSAVIAKILSKETKISCLLDALVRTRSTPSQGHLNAKERFKNVKRAFAVNPKMKDRIKGKTIVLVDDVYTTGATVQECSKALLKAGSAKVHVLTLARVARPGFNN